jgi:hypothetical protein
MTDEQEKQGKYGALIQKAREQENQKSVKPDDQMTSQSESEKPTTQRTGKPNNQKSVKPDSQLTSQPEAEEVKERDVNLCVKVPESLRRHWAAESKRQGITMTEVIVQALEERFGRPE